MKYCPKCGEENLNNATFCKSCGNQFINNVANNEIKKKEGLGVASIVLGIISLVLAFLVNIFIIPLALVGLILGIINKAMKGKKFAGIILNALAIILSVIVFFVILFIMGIGISEFVNSDEGKDYLNKFYNELDRQTSDNYVEGTWNCKSFDGSGESDNYIVTMKLNEDYTFYWGKYNDDTNYVTGTYTFTDLEKKNNSGDYAYYNVKLDGEDFYMDGEKQEEEYKSEYEMGITSIAGKKQAVMINPKSYNMYYCYRK